MSDLKAIAEQWLQSKETWALRYSNAHPDKNLSREQQEIELLAAFGRTVQQQAYQRAIDILKQHKQELLAQPHYDAARIDEIDHLLLALAKEEQ